MCGVDENGCNGGMHLRSQTTRQLRTKRQKDIKELFIMMHGKAFGDIFEVILFSLQITCPDLVT